MKQNLSYEKLEELVVRDSKLVFTMVSYVTILIIFINLSFTNSLWVGAPASLAFFWINGIFLGRTFFENETLFVRFMMGNLLLIAFLGLASWLVMIAYNLDVLRSAIALSIVATACSLMSKLEKISGKRECK